MGCCPIQNFLTKAIKTIKIYLVEFLSLNRFGGSVSHTPILPLAILRAMGKFLSVTGSLLLLLTLKLPIYVLFLNRAGRLVKPVASGDLGGQKAARIGGDGSSI